MRMAASSGEPRTLLNALKPMLGLSGDIKTPQEVVRIISLMRDAEKLMSRCIYINILTATIGMSKEEEHSSETLEKFIATGGWGILNKWLVDAKKSDDFHVMLEVLKVLRDLPVSVDTLKQGTIGKIVKQLSKSENEDIKKLSTGILRQWMNLVRNKSGAEKIKQNGSVGANAQGANSVSSPLSESGKSGKRMRENQSSPQPEKKAKTLGEVKGGISHKPVSKTNIIPPQAKPAAMESTGFMNALASAAAPVPVRKRKRATTAAKTATTSTTSTSRSSTANSTKANYTGILDEIMNSQSQTHGLEDREKEHTPKEANPDSTNKAQPSPEASPQDTPSALGDSSDPGNDKDLDTDKENAQSSLAHGSETIQVESSVVEGEKAVKKSKKGKKVTWASDEKINTYHFFEMDEEERALVRHPVNFTDAQHMEMKRERELVEQAKRLSEDRMSEKLKWYRPRRIERQTSVDTGSKSEQKTIQSDRESSILADLFLTKSSLPDSAAEPDPEVEKIERGEPKVIPHDEKGTTHLPEKAPPLSVLPAALASLFSSGAGATGKPGATLQPGAQDAQLSVQNLLDKLMASGEKPSSGTGQASNPLTQLLSAQKQQQQPPQQDLAGPVLPTALQQILQPLQHKMTGPGPRGPGVPAGQGLLGAAPGDMTGTLNTRPPGLPFGPRGPGNMPVGPVRFPGPGGPRQGNPMGPHFPGPEGLGPRHRGPTPMRMQRPPGPGRGALSGPRPLLPELNHQQEENFVESADLCEQEDGEYLENGPPPMRGRGRGMPRGRGRGRARGRDMPLCRHFVTRRGCLRGNTCIFIHPGINAPPL